MKHQYPLEFISNINLLLGSEAPHFWTALGESAVKGLRINPAKTSLPEIQSALPGEYVPLPWSDNGFQLKTAETPGKHPFHAAGLYYLQEPSAMAPVAILDPRPGESVLDLCAAPGGKTTQIQARMGDQGILVANDSNPRRVQALARNLERWGTRVTAVLCETPRRLSDHYGAYFDRVLVDAPCSGEGTFRSAPGEIKKWSPAFSQRCSVLQDEILWFAGKLVRPGGLLVYSTCTFNQMENEGSVARFLNRNPDFELEAIPRRDGYAEGIELDQPDQRNLSRSVRIWPHLSPGEGHFAARLRKISGTPNPDHPLPGSKAGTDPRMREIYSGFFSHTLRETKNTGRIKPSSQEVRSYGNRLYWVPDTTPALEGLNVIHWGWWLGTIQRDTFIPSPALASALDAGDLQTVLEFSLGEPRLDSYLRGSPVALANSDRNLEEWTLVTVGGHPLGWGKIQGGRLKSYFPRWLREY